MENLMNHNVITGIEFMKVSEKQFIEDAKKCFNIGDNEKHPLEIFHRYYEEIKLPTRATAGSMGYDFYSPFNFNIIKGDWVTIPTGIRVKLPQNTGLILFPRSGQGFKYHISLANTAGVIDSDYFNADNEGHIMIKLVNNGLNQMDILKTYSLEDELNFWLYDNEEATKKDNGMFKCVRGTAIAQGIILPYLVAVGDNVTTKRTGGFGSTTK